MATETDSDNRFGRVSRRRGILFRYLLLAATLVGIVALAVLLTKTALDAFGFTGPGGSGYGGPPPAWYLVYFLTLVVPTTTLSVYYYRENRSAGVRGLATLGLLVAGLMAGGGALVFFVVVDPLVYLSYVLGVVFTVGTYLAHGRVTPGRSFRERAGLTALVGWLTLLGAPEEPAVAVTKIVYGLAGLPTNFNGLVGLPVPSLAIIVQQLPIVPTPWAIYLWTVALPLAALLGGLTYRREANRLEALTVVGLVVGVALVGGLLLSLVTPIPRAPATLVVTFGLAPLGYFVERTIRESTKESVALLFPILIAGGSLVGAAVVESLGISSPDTWLDWQFLTNLPSSFPADAGVYPALVGSVLLMLVVIALSFPIGVGAAVYLEEYAPDSRTTRLIQVNISNLAGVPSVVYGLLGLGVFIRFFGLGIGSLLVAGMALALLILPIIIISSREAIRSVPDSQRQASYGMGATKWQTVKNVVLPRAIPGILTGTILALGRAVGETAPLIMVGAAQTTFSVPVGLSDTVSALPMQIYAWAFQPSEIWRYRVLPAGVVVILAVLLTMNATAIILRNRYETEG